MKKIILISLMAVSLFTLSACGNKRVESDRLDYTVLEELGTKEITIDFWTGFKEYDNRDNNDILRDLAADFKEIYPNITVNVKGYDTYNDLTDAVTKALASNDNPALVQTYPDHVAGYNSSNSVLPLDNFIESEKWGLTSDDIEDFVSAYYNEGKIYGDGLMYSLPFNKSSEVLFYNKDVFTAAGVDFPDADGWTWAEYEAAAEKLLKYAQDNNVEGFKTVGLHDSSPNLFPTIVRQWGGETTKANSAGTGGEYLFNSQAAIDGLEYFKTLNDSQYLSNAQVTYGTNIYGSNLFKNGLIYISIGSTAGVKYQLPSSSYVCSSSDIGNVPGCTEENVASKEPIETQTFEVGVSRLPQHDADENGAVISQGTNVSILSKNTTDEQRLASWLFLKYITDTEAQTTFCLENGGYFPVRNSSVESDLYQEFLTDDHSDNAVNALLSETTKIGVMQKDLYFVDEAFPGSSSARTYYTNIINAVFANTKTAKDALQAAFDELSR